MPHITRRDRLYNNTEIQESIVAKASLLSSNELDKYCKDIYSKIKFDLNYSLFIKMPKDSSEEVLQNSIKDHTNQNRWTWRYKFEVGSHVYAITTQWYDRNDEYVQIWLRNN